MDVSLKYALFGVFQDGIFPSCPTLMGQDGKRLVYKGSILPHTVVPILPHYVNFRVATSDKKQPHVIQNLTYRYAKPIYFLL